MAKKAAEYEKPRIKTILFPTDFSEDAYRALPYLGLIAEGREIAVHLLHVLPAVAADVGSGPFWSHGGFQTGTFLEAARKRLEEEKLRFHSELRPVAVEVRLGDAAAVIDQYARQIGADLIVMSTHQPGWFERLFMGSVAEQTLRDAPCPVLVVPAALG